MTLKAIKTGIIGAMAAGLLVAAPAMAATTNVAVYPGNTDGWTFANDQVPGGPATGTFVNGPETPPMGTGSAQLTTAGPTDGQILYKEMLKGTKLTDLTELKYSTYQSDPNSSNATAIALQLVIDKDVTDTDNAFQGRLVYEPYNNNGGSVPAGEWTEWNALGGVFWLSRSATNFGGFCPQADPCTLAELTEEYSNIGIHPTLGGLVFKAGSGWTNPFSGNVDALKIGTAGNTTVYNFEAVEPPVVLTSKDACKNGGWKTSTDPVFKNQGDCVSHFASKKNTNPVVSFLSGLLKN